jgi:metallo-beta-lactamase family protein
MILTHAHIDHSGLIPRLCNSGFKKPIFTTKATFELSKVSLPDSGHIQEMEAEWRNRKRLRKGLKEEEPLYTAQDALDALQYFVTRDYQEEFQPAPGVRVRLLDAGHILGSAIIELWITEAGEEIKLVFSGDLGQKNQPIIQDPTVIGMADYIVVESTYGNRFHEEHDNKTELLKKVIFQTVKSGGNLIIPAFAVGRTQDILYHLKNLFLEGAIPRMPVYIDSPMAVSVTEIYRSNPGYYDEPTLKMLTHGDSPFEFDGLHFIRTAEESKQLNLSAKGSIIISANGMCEAGRILHHLKHNLWRADSHILFVGYQAEGTLGRRLLEGAKVVKVMGEEVNVQATIHSIDGFSAHADQNGLMEWLGGFRSKPRGIFIVHGEPAAEQELSSLIKSRFNLVPQIPMLGETYKVNALVHRTPKTVEVDVPNYVVEQTLGDLEHAVLGLRSRVRLTGSAQYTDELKELRNLIDKLDGLLKKA